MSYMPPESRLCRDGEDSLPVLERMDSLDADRIEEAHSENDSTRYYLAIESQYSLSAGTAGQILLSHRSFSQVHLDRRQPLVT